MFYVESTGIMSERIVWKNLHVSDFIHPEEAKVKENVINSAAFQKAIAALSDINIKIHETIIEGTYIKLSQKTAPHIMAILDDVCRILDCEQIPDVYVCHQMSQLVQPCSADRNYLVVADYVIKTFDDDMLYYLFGNAMAMIMADHVKMTTVAAYMGANLWTIIPQIEFKHYLHLADATSDRGGLLACQSITAVAKCHLLELGLPVKFTRRYCTSERETEIFIEQYLAEIHKNALKKNLLNKAAEVWINSTYMEGAANFMLEDLYHWYQTGYQNLRKQYLDRYSSLTQK